MAFLVEIEVDDEDVYQGILDKQAEGETISFRVGQESVRGKINTVTPLADMPVFDENVDETADSSH